MYQHEDDEWRRGSFTDSVPREWEGGAHDREALGVCGHPNDDRYGGDR